jgi:hypothetical protein
MLYDLVKVSRGRETVVMTDALPRVNDRLRTLRASHRGRGQRVELVVRPSQGDSKFKQRPSRMNLSGDGKWGGQQRIR